MLTKKHAKRVRSISKFNYATKPTTNINPDLNDALNIRDKGLLELKAAGQSSLLIEAA
ncbi:hypothetical protein VCRA2121O65_400016 [Vibrio crassostreae]|nr:hypothetical protein VCRA2113O324_180103 [Vibrio crassostreae]CAK2395673.1 hypothetical protein VCRA2119O52_1090011 [Vibrio crassostreae]CAK3004666.1 hypothetical protein VCRA2120O56_400015 [Vibrio crassostreae]CAK3407879.1 hypothetical protein VCRA2128O94_410014 [Vibrio crassostreae]CAK3467071.1 hypothetical protein VCRA2120O64_410015 [Vibrio crassostreae]